MATAGGILAEAYVMRKLHKEKMKQAKAQDEESETGNHLVAQQTKPSPSGACFLGICLRKKVNPNFDGKRANTTGSGII